MRLVDMWIKEIHHSPLFPLSQYLELSDKMSVELSTRMLADVVLDVDPHSHTEPYIWRRRGSCRHLEWRMQCGHLASLAYIASGWR